MRTGCWLKALVLNLLGFSLIVSCGDDPPPGPTGLRYNEAHFASTHNSYSGDIGGARRSIIEQLDHGIRCIELDIHIDGFAAYGYRVGHASPGDEVFHQGENPISDKLSVWLDVVANWSDQHPTHAPITIYIDAKDEFGVSYAAGNFAHLIEDLEQAFGDRLFKAEKMESGDWPTVEELRGKVITVITGKEGYVRDAGYSPAIAINSSGHVIEVHHSGSEELWYWTGQLQSGGKIEWHRHGKYTTGQRPAIALNNDGLVVEVHQAHNDYRLFYRVGKLDSDFEIQWYGSGSSQFPSGDLGRDPSVAFLDLDGIEVREVHQSSANDADIWHWDGVYDNSTNEIDWGEHGKNIYSRYDKTTASLGAVTLKVTTGAHGPFASNTLIYRQDDGDWQRIHYAQVLFLNYSKGGSPWLLALNPWFFNADARNSASRSWAQGWLNDKRIVRLYAFNEATYGITPPATFASTDYPFSSWYISYCNEVSCVE
ncbi:phosphatidylinositol-specific phospholipase C domain-containing protein [Candidatus Zixiibacteriota bacterium]